MVDKYKLSELNRKIDKNFDLFLCCSSFEDRCFAVAQNINIEKLGEIIIFYSVDFIDYVGKNKNILKKLLGDGANCIDLKHSDPLYSADNMQKAIKKISEKTEVNSILLDITTFTHEALLMLLRLLHIVFPKAEIICAYTNASEYDSANKKEDKWLSKGIGDIRSVLGYSGDILPNRKTHLIVIVGYEYERAINIINAIEPSSLALGFGRSDNATTEKDKDANEHYKMLVERMTSSFTNITSFEVKCDSPFETYKELVKQVDNEKDKNILIVPLNNKISTIGAAFSAINNDDIQLCYAPALIYNFSDYSKVGDSCYIINITSMFNVNNIEGI